MPKGIGYGSKRAPYKVSDAKMAPGASERGAVQSPFKSKDKIARKASRGRGRGR